MLKRYSTHLSPTSLINRFCSSVARAGLRAVQWLFLNLILLLTILVILVLSILVIILLIPLHLLLTLDSLPRVVL